MYELMRLGMRQGATDPASDIITQFQAITPSHFHCCLYGTDPNDVSDTDIIAVGALDQGTPIGIALASCYRHIHHVQLHYIFVLPNYRKRHLARNMLEKLQYIAKDEGGRYYTFIYKLEDPETPALEKVLKACDWKPAQPFMIECRYNSFMFNPPWIHTSYQLPNTMEEFSWSELTQKDREQILHDEQRGVIPYAVLPFREEQNIEPLNSLGLRFEKRVIGWMITHRTATDTIAYRSLYVEKAFHFLGPGIKLLIDSMLIHKTLPIKWALFELPLLQVDPLWTHFVNKRLIPYADEITHFVQAWRDH